jgi:alkylated DNA repair dioxygenase AlkB
MKPNLPSVPVRPPEGLRYAPDFLPEAEEADLVRRIGSLPFTPFGRRKRQTLAFGWTYRYGARDLARAMPNPHWLLDLRDRAAAFAGLATDALEHTMLTKYEEGAGFGWHCDLAGFGDVLGISLLSPAPLRFRRKPVSTFAGGAGTERERFTLPAEPRSAYLLRGPSRIDWEHSLAPVDRLRYSITFRTLN